MSELETFVLTVAVLIGGGAAFVAARRWAANERIKAKRPGREDPPGDARARPVSDRQPSERERERKLASAPPKGAPPREKPVAAPGQLEDFGDDDDITLVTVHADLQRLRAELAGGGDLKRAFENEYLEYVVREIDEDLEPTARAHGLIADLGAEKDQPTLATAAFLVSSARQTDQGQRRPRNEDRFLCLPDEGIFFVADGMGGYAGGDVAAQLAVDTIEKAFVEGRFEARVASDLPRRPTELAQAMQMANLAIWERSTDEPELRGMGTTLVGARFALRKRRVYIGHIGDSRCYRLRGTELRQLTLDHTLASYGVSGPTRHRLVRAVGIGAEVEIDLIVGEPRVGDLYLFCSDGLNKMVPDAEIVRVLRSTNDLDEASKQLVDLANERGGKDNITVVLVAVRPPAEAYLARSKSEAPAAAQAESEGE